MSLSRHILGVMIAVSAVVVPAVRASETTISMTDGRWHLNGELTYPGTQSEGLLMNVRMVNCVFEDRRRSDFDVDANTQEFIEQVPDYVAHGVRAFTICLQGGMPGYEGALNSAFHSDGSLRDEYMSRIRRVIDVCDRNGAAVILTCFYQRQDQVLANDGAVRAALVNTATWITDEGFTNVVLEIANEFPHRGFNHDLIRTVEGQIELHELVRQTTPRLLVGTSGLGHGRFPDRLAEASDFLLIHFNNTPVEAIPERIEALQKFGKPIVCNEDVKEGQEGARAAELCVSHGASWGLMLVKHNQWFPFEFDGSEDDPVVYEKLKELTSSPSTDIDSHSYSPPPDTDGGWRQLTSPDEVQRETGIDTAKLDEAFEYIQGASKNGGLLVVRHGWLVYERYFGRGHHEATANLASCGKSLTSICVGILMAERPELFPDGLDQKVFTPTYFPREAFPLSDPSKQEIKLGQLLAFSAGIRGNNPSYVEGETETIEPQGPDGWRALVDDIAMGTRVAENRNGKPNSAATLWCEPGGGYSYATASIHLASIMLRHVTGQELEQYVGDHLAKPLGWGRWDYGYRYAKQVTHTPGGGGIVLRPTDMLRFGYLLLHEGCWNGKQLVPADYVRHCRSQSPYNPHYPYSLQFNVNTNGAVPGLPRDAFWKTGSGGHAIYVVPSLDLVVWKLGGRDGQYTERDTGMTVHSEAAQQADPRPGWTATVDEVAARTRTLERVIASIKK